MTPHLLVIDNYDSFTYNLVQMFSRYPIRIRVDRADRVPAAGPDGFEPDYILVSPGPRDPAHAGVSVPLIRHFAGRVPILGVCLGMQSINEAFGGKTVRAPVPVHGKTSQITHDGKGVFARVPSSFQAARYHSLACANLPEVLHASAMSEDGVIMGLNHRFQKIFGVQFHPESFLSEYGYVIIENFLESGPMAGKLPLAYSGAPGCPEALHADPAGVCSPEFSQEAALS